MKGLVYKDLMLLKIQKNSLLFLIAVMIFLSFTTLNSGGTVGFSCFMVLMTIMGTYSSDEYNNFLTYMMTLPVSRKVYIQSKYMFAIGLLLLTWLFSIALTFVFTLVLRETVSLFVIISTIVVLEITIILFSIAFPLLVKYGNEKGRIIIAGIVGALSGGMIYIMQVSSNLLQESSGPVASFYLVIVLSLIMMFILLISYRISVKILNKKDL